MYLNDFDYELPDELIAQSPADPRDSSRLLVLNRSDGSFCHRRFTDVLSWLNPGDVLVFNQTRVIPARLRGHKLVTGGRVELLLLEKLGETTWRGIIGGKGVNEGARLRFSDGDSETEATVLEVGERSERIVQFSSALEPLLEKLGEVPLPPYIHQPLSDPDRYQTVYARDPGSAAAPTAGLHFTPDLMIRLRDKGVRMAFCTLHVGLDTFQPVQEHNLLEHRMHSERIYLSPENANLINEAKLAGGKLVAVGTTSVRVLEAAALRSADIDDPYSANAVVCPWRPVQAIDQSTSLFIRPGYRFRAVDALITNFHLPKSTLLMLVSAFAGREQILASYELAKQEGYRFYSFGDAMLIL